MHVQIKRAHDRLVEDFEHVQVANDDEQILRRLGPLVATTRGEIDDDFLEDSRTDLRWDGCVQLGSAVVHARQQRTSRSGRQLCTALDWRAWAWRAHACWRNGPSVRSLGGERRPNTQT